MNLLIAVPAYGQMIHQTCTRSLLGLIAGLEQEDTNYQTLFIASACIQSARNDFIDYALCAPDGFTHILFVDADMGFRWEDFVLLRGAGKRLITGLCPKKKYPIEWVIGAPKAMPELGGIQQHTYGSIAFALIDLSVFRSHPVQFYGARSSVTGQEKMIGNWFPAGPNWRGIFHSEDRAFFALMEKLGEPCFVHHEARITHSGQHTFKGES